MKTESTKEIATLLLPSPQPPPRTTKSVENESTNHPVSLSSHSLQSSPSNSEKKFGNTINENNITDADFDSNNNNSMKIQIKINQQDPFQRGRNSHQRKIRFREYGIDDFRFLTLLGRGSFGKVMLAELINHDCHFAVKCLKKETVIEDDDVESIMIERKVLAYGTSHPFICKLFCTFQTEVCLFESENNRSKTIDFSFQINRVIYFFQWNFVPVVILCFMCRKKENFLKIKQSK